MKRVKFIRDIRWHDFSGELQNHGGGQVVSLPERDAKFVIAHGWAIEAPAAKSEKSKDA